MKLKKYKVKYDLTSEKEIIKAGTIIEGFPSGCSSPDGKRYFDDIIKLKDGRMWLDLNFEEIK